MEARWLPNTGANQALIVILFFIRPILREKERERGKALKLGFKQSICGSSERRVEKSFGKGSFLPSVTSRLLPFL